MHISHNMHLSDRPSPVVILGCGNDLLGDDGFGPAVIARLVENGLPSPISARDVGTAVREHLLDYLMAPTLRPDLLIVVDADPDEGGVDGHIRLCGPEDLPARKIHDFSLHQFPTVNLLRELHAQTGIRVILLLARITPPIAVDGPGLSPPLRAAVDRACAAIPAMVAPYLSAEATVP